AETDEDGEFVAAVFQLPSVPKLVGVVGLHAQSKVKMGAPQDQGGSRALLRHAIHQLRLKCDHTVILGDFNSSLLSREIQSWHGFYALSTHKRVETSSSATRRGFDHRPLYVVRPSNEPTGTFVYEDTGGIDPCVLDFIAVDEATRSGSRSEIM